MSNVRITKEGLKYFEGDSVELVRTFLGKLRCTCAIDLGVTLGDIFAAVERDRPLKHFIGGYSWCDMDAFHQEAKLPSAKPSDLLYIDVSSHFEFGEGWIIDVHGIGKDEHAMGNRSYAIDFTPVNDLAHLEVRLTEECAVFDENLKEIGKSKVYFSLLDVLGEIYFEVSFHGNPRDRNEKSAELLQAVKEIESGEAKLTPWEDLKPSKTTVN
jgi:hypothetical protein